MKLEGFVDNRLWGRVLDMDLWWWFTWKRGCFQRQRSSVWVPLFSSYWHCSSQETKHREKGNAQFNWKSHNFFIGEDQFKARLAGPSPKVELAIWQSPSRLGLF